MEGLIKGTFTLCKISFIKLFVIKEDQELETVAVEAPDCRWDAESILTTYSNKYNHPKLIRNQLVLFMSNLKQIIEQ